MKQIPVCIRKSESKVKRKIQNRKSSRKVRARTKGRIIELEIKICSLEKQNTRLINQNEELISENKNLKKKCQFYQKNFQKNLSKIEEKVSNGTVMMDNGNIDLKRVEEPNKQNFIKNYTLLTILTVMIQFLDVDFYGQNKILTGENIQLKSLDVSDQSTSFCSFLLKHLSLIFSIFRYFIIFIWVSYLLINRKKFLSNQFTKQ